MLVQGTQAPSFTLPSSQGGTLNLDELRGNPVVLVYYPGDNTPVCTNQLSLYNEILENGLFDEFNAKLIGISVDSIESHNEFSNQLGLSFPILADNPPIGEVSKLYGVFDEENNQSKRAIFVIDAEGMIRWSYVSPIGENPGADGILRALESL